MLVEVRIPKVLQATIYILINQLELIELNLILADQSVQNLVIEADADGNSVEHCLAKELAKKVKKIFDTNDLMREIVYLVGQLICVGSLKEH